MMEVKALNKPSLAQWTVEELFNAYGARSGIIEFYQDPDNVKRFNEWKQERDKRAKATRC